MKRLPENSFWSGIISYSSAHSGCCKSHNKPTTTSCRTLKAVGCVRVCVNVLLVKEMRMQSDRESEKHCGQCVIHTYTAHTHTHARHPYTRSRTDKTQFHQTVKSPVSSESLSTALALCFSFSALQVCDGFFFLAATCIRFGVWPSCLCMGEYRCLVRSLDYSPAANCGLPVGAVCTSNLCYEFDGHDIKQRKEK